MLAASVLGASAAVAAQGPCHLIAFVGTLDWTKLYPKHSPRQSTAVSDGYMPIVVENRCGNAETKFAVTRVLAGPPVTSLVVDSELGEWCEPPVRIDLHPNLVSATKEHGKWVMNATAPVTRDKAGAAIVLPDSPYPQTFLGVSIDQLRKPLAQPIYWGNAKDKRKPDLKTYVQSMERRGILKRIGKEYGYVSAVYISDLRTALRNDSDLRAQGCIP